MSQHLTFITGNSGKAEQLSRYLGIPVAHQKIDLVEIQSLDLTEVVKHKVITAYQHLKQPVLVDDVSLIIHSLGKLPGPFIKYFIAELGVEGICKLVSNFADKSATANVAIGYYDGADLKIFQSEITGSIANTPNGQGGFGWDAIFIPNGYSKTRAAMTEEDYNKTSPRKNALIKLEGYLKSLVHSNNGK